MSHGIGCRFQEYAAFSFNELPLVGITCTFPQNLYRIAKLFLICQCTEYIGHWQNDCTEIVALQQDHPKTRKEKRQEISSVKQCQTRDRSAKWPTSKPGLYNWVSCGGKNTAERRFEGRHMPVSIREPFMPMVFLDFRKSSPWTREGQLLAAR